MSSRANTACGGLHRKRSNSEGAKRHGEAFVDTRPAAPESSFFDGARGRIEMVSAAMRLLLCLLWAFAIALPSSLHAQDTGFFVHTPLSPAALNGLAPGKPLKLAVSLAKAKSADTRLRALVTLDGRVMDLPLAATTYSDSDKITFSAEVPAPLERMSYRFFAFGEEGSRTETSSTYVLERSCVPVFPENSDPNVTPIAPAQQEGIGRLVAQNDDLERELDLLTSALRSVTVIDGLVKR